MCFTNLCDDWFPGTDIDPPPGAKLVTAGGSGSLYAFPNNETEIVKIFFNDPDSIQDMNTEKEIFENFKMAESHAGAHPNIVKCIRVIENGIVLERVKYGDLREYFQKGGTATEKERMKWCKDLASALDYIHCLNTIHADLCGKNILLDADRNIKLCDFASSSFCGRPPRVWPEAGYAHPIESHVRRGTMKSEMHALGSTIYEIITTRRPFELETREEAIRQFVRNGIYPEVDQLPLGSVMTKCWQGEYHSAFEVEADIVIEMEQGSQCAYTHKSTKIGVTLDNTNMEYQGGLTETQIIRTDKCPSKWN